MGEPPATCGEWVVVIESASTAEFGVVAALLSRLREWRSSGLYQFGRYTVKLRITAVAPDEALHRAVAYHALAARSVGISTASVTRAEVMTAAEYELGVVLPPAEPPLVHDALISEELYAATRALLRAVTPAEITEIIVRFVTAVGASVTVGDCRQVGGGFAVDIAIEGDQALRAIAEARSGPGAIIEQTLPALVADARLSLLRLGGTRN